FTVLNNSAESKERPNKKHVIVALSVSVHVPQNLVALFGMCSPHNPPVTKMTILNYFKIHIEQSTEHDENENENENISPSNKEEKLASYIWTQTSTDITVCFQLPVGTLKTAIHCNFSKTHLSLTIKTEDDAFDTTNTTNTNLRPRPPLPCYAFSQFFDNIDPDASLWTIEPNIGLLTLHIEKANHKTRWSHVFHNDDGVFETLDPNEFAEFRESLEKYTTDLLASSSSNETVRFETIKPPFTVLNNSAESKERPNKKHVIVALSVSVHVPQNLVALFGMCSPHNPPVTKMTILNYFKVDDEDGRSENFVCMV
ncbi:1192_t:CDS:2, partial [Entrophospora sp. SA101]